MILWQAAQLLCFVVARLEDTIHGMCHRSGIIVLSPKWPLSHFTEHLGQEICEAYLKDTKDTRAYILTPVCHNMLSP